MAKYIPGDPQRLLDKVWQMADERFAQGVPQKGLKELLTALDDRGMPRIVASSSPRTMIEMNLQNTGTARYFHDVVSGTEVKHSKRARHVLLAAENCTSTRRTAWCWRTASTVCVVRARLRDRDGAGHDAAEEIMQLYDRKCEDLLEVRDLLVEGSCNKPEAKAHFPSVCGILNVGGPRTGVHLLYSPGVAETAAGGKLNMKTVPTSVG